MWHYGFLQNVNHAYVISRVNCIHIGVGFDVARSTTLGNAKASKCGTGDRLVHAFLYFGSWSNDAFNNLINN